MIDHGRTNAAAEPSSNDHALVERCIQERLANCSYHYYFNKVRWTFEKGQLTLEGCVPTFYMKQVLQTLLRDIQHVKQIVNEVDVVSSTGLSSVRKK